jgi:hypothetical protein
MDCLLNISGVGATLYACGSLVEKLRARFLANFDTCTHDVWATISIYLRLTLEFRMVRSSFAINLSILARYDKYWIVLA